MALLTYMNNEQIEKVKAEKLVALTDIIEPEVVDEVSSYVWSCWLSAVLAKDPYEQQMLKNKRQTQGLYDEDKLSAITQIGGSDVFMLITDTKCQGAEQWVKEALTHSGDMPYGIEPTPLPELPPELREEIESEIFKTAMQASIQAMITSGGQVHPLEVYVSILEEMPKIKEDVEETLRKHSLETAKKMKVKLDDQLSEGNFLYAIEQSIPDVILSTGFIRGPLQKKRWKHVPSRDSKTGRITMKQIEEIYCEYTSPSCFDIYPSPESKGIEDGYLFERLRMTPQELQDCIGLPGFDEEAIRDILARFNDGSFSGRWLNLQIDSDLQAIAEGDTVSSYNSPDSDKIDVLLFWGAISGKDLVDWGMPDIEDEDKWYDCYAYYIDKKVVCARFNKNFGGVKPYGKTSFRNRKGQFWGTGLPEAICDIQTICNACVRAIVNNVGIASGPQVERNIDRVPREMLDDDIMYPWKVWDVTNEQMGNAAPALKFYQPQMVVERIVNVFMTFLKLADEHSGVPAYAMGESRVGGAGRTASGLKMLMAGTARGIKNLIHSFDVDLIAPCVERQYYWNIINEENYALVADYRIVAKGSQALLAKEQQEVRRLEFATMTGNNQMDAQIIGIGGRKYMLSELAEQLGWDKDRLFGTGYSAELDDGSPAPDGPPMGMGEGGMDMPPGGGMAQRPPGAAPRTLDAAGSPSQGTDMRPRPMM
jgi:hypothetical protein